MERKHSKLPPSSAARRVVCPGSRALEEKYRENTPSLYAREGEAAHWLASEMLAAKICGLFENLNPLHALNGELITAEMIESALLYVNEISKTTTAILHIEETIDISTIHPECFGTPDCWAFENNTLFVWDFKYGHTPVEVFKNWQLIEYSAGILDKLKIKDPSVTVIFCIIQPRSFHQEGPIRKWEIKINQLDYYFNMLRTKENQAIKDEAPCFVSSECNFCLARHACPTLQTMALITTDISKLNIPWDLSPELLGYELRYLQHAHELLDARLTGIKEQITALIKKGERIPFFRLERSNGREQWKTEVTEIIALGELIGINLKKPDDVITPRQAVKAGVPLDIVNSYTQKTNGSLKLVIDENSEARKIFGGGE